MSASIGEALAALATMSSAQLREEWRTVFRKPAPSISPDLMERALAYELQARRHGELEPTVRRKIERFSRRMTETGDPGELREISIKPGTRLSRDWHGRTHHVLALEEGFMFEDRYYGSLTQVAAAITGAHWSGPRFFGLKTRARVGVGHGEG